MKPPQAPKKTNYDHATSDLMYAFIPLNVGLISGFNLTQLERIGRID